MVRLVNSALLVAHRNQKPFFTSGSLWNRYLPVWLPIILLGAVCSYKRIANAAEPSQVTRARGPAPRFALLHTAGDELIISGPTSRTQHADNPMLPAQQSFWSPDPAGGNVVNGFKKLSLDKFEIYTLKGQKYNREDLPALLKWLRARKTPVRILISTDGKMVDPFYRQFIAQPALIVVPLRQQNSQQQKPLSHRKQDVSIAFRNHSPFPINIVWVNSQGHELDFGTLQPGKQYLQQTHMGHFWRFKLFGEIVASLKITRNTAGTFEIRTPQHSLTSIEAEVFKAINVIRKQYQLPTLRHDSRLSLAARDHSRYMSRSGNFSHYSSVPGKGSFMERARAFQTTAISENIAWDGGTARSVVQMWMNSPGHRANILDPSARRMGIGKSGVYWTQMFGAGK
ncbi:MAG: hypothetical protein Tsb009_32860 [Planctomycetaceae bacterium]